jgi:hypothetical protein
MKAAAEDTYQPPRREIPVAETTIYTTYKEQYDSPLELYIKSEPIPEYVIEYAQLQHPSIAHGFTAYEYDTAASKVYYFPVVNEYEIVSMLLVIDYGYPDYVNLSMQLSEYEMGENLNLFTTTPDSPIIVLIAKNGFYAVDTDNNITLIQTTNYFPAENEEVSDPLSDPNISFSDMSEELSETVLISYDTAYNKDVPDPIISSILFS